ncbi:MAG: hypothetical protein KatS3mg105_4768 [Gemmatales bacterium]|nr:MAG: hypothetical protein KatS3mg105_4768 [Gemmatales bacterium]
MKSSMRGRSPFRHMQWLWLAAVLLVQAAPLRAEEIHWYYDYNLARSLAQKKNLPLLLDIGTNNCYYCVRLDKTTMRHPTIVEIVNKEFIPLKIHAPSNPSLVDALQIQAYPTVVLAAPDGKILATLEGYMDATRFQGHLNRALASLSNPEWMTRDFAEAKKAISESDFARAIALLRGLVEDGKQRPVQIKAKELLAQLESKGTQKLDQAKLLHSTGQTKQAIELATDVLKSFAGTQAAVEAGPLVKAWAIQAAAPPKVDQRSQRARELLAQAREAYDNKQFLICLEHCEQLAQNYTDLSEGMEAIRLANEIKANPEWLRQACDTLSNRLGGLYLSLAETWLAKGQPHEAMLCLEKVIVTFPGTRQADAAQIRLDQIRGNPTRPVNYNRRR